MPIGKSAAGNSQWAAQGLAVSQWHSWEAAHPPESMSGQQRVLCASRRVIHCCHSSLFLGAPLGVQGADGAASPSSSSSPDVTRSFPQWSSSARAHAQDILFLFTVCLKVTVDIIRHLLAKYLFWFQPPCVRSLQPHSAEFLYVLC